MSVFTQQLRKLRLACFGLLKTVIMFAPESDNDNYLCYFYIRQSFQFLLNKCQSFANQHYKPQNHNE